MMEPIVPIQHRAPIQNNVTWYVIAIAIIAGSALLSYGIGKNFARWEEEAGLPKWFSILGEVVGIVLATTGGAIVGYLVWHWALGALAGHVGGWASPWVVHRMRGAIEKRRGGG